MIIFDRSRREAWEKCNRFRFLGYEFDGRGIERRGLNADLLLGQAVHEGIEALLTHGNEDFAAGIAAGTVIKGVNEVGLLPDMQQLPSGEIVSGTANQFLPEFLVALADALVRGWARVRYPLIMRDFEVVSLEREEQVEIAPGVILLTRSDFVGRRKIDKSLFVFNFKTTRSVDYQWSAKWRTDQQTLSEVLPIEARLGTKLGGVIIEGLVKGPKKIEWPRGSGNWFNTSPLVWGYKKPDSEPFPAEYACRYEWIDEMGSNRRLGKDFRRTFMGSEPGGIREWINWIESRDPQLLEQQFVSLPPILRSEYEIESWKRSVVYSEREIQGFNLILKSQPNLLDEFFPKHTSDGNCTGYSASSACPFFGICWENHDPGDDSLYQPRHANHPKEAELRDWVPVEALKNES